MTGPARVVRRIWRGDDSRRSRLHTRDGEFLGLRGARQLAGACLRRVRPARSNTLPWLAPGAVRYLDVHLKGRERFLELGAGASTAWFARTTSTVISLEDSPAWADQVRGQLTRLGIKNVDLRTGPLDVLLDECLRLTDGFDVVLVDQNETHLTRVEAVELLADRVNAGGLLILDDSDRPEYERAFHRLQTWRQLRFAGYRRVPLTPTVTTIFIRP